MFFEYLEIVMHGQKSQHQQMMQGEVQEKVTVTDYLSSKLQLSATLISQNNSHGLLSSYQI